MTSRFRTLVRNIATGISQENGMTATTNNVTQASAANLKAAFERFRANPKILFLIAAAASISIVIALILWAQKPEYRVLFSNISDQDGGSIVAQLGQMNIPYRFSGGGGAIMVPADQVHEARLKLAQQGLPKGGAVGFELLDQERFGISQFSEQINYQRALEGELARTIETLGPVVSARIHLAIPKPSLFVREKKHPSASITLQLHAGRSLDQSQVSAITWLVSSAVPGLTAENVTLVDQHGNLMTITGSQAQQTSQLKYTTEIEADYRQRIHSILAPIVGSKNVKAQVTAQIDFTHMEQTSEQFQPNAAPDKKAVRSQQISGSQQGGASAASGVPGALSNLPPTPSSAPLEEPARTQNNEASTATPKNRSAEAAQAKVPYNSRNDETTNYELDRTLTHTKRSTGTIERLSVAVVVNWLPDSEGNSKALSQEQLTQINALIKEAIGFNAARGDTVNVVNSPFTDADQEEEPPFWKEPSFIDLMQSMARYAFIAIVAWVLWRKLVQPFWMKHQELALQRLELEKEARQAELDAHAQKKENMLKKKAHQRAEAEINSHELRKMADNEPQVIALVMRQWINKEMK